MARGFRRRREKSQRNVRTDVREDALDSELLFEPVLADVAALLWPSKTAENLAAETGCTVRAAEFYLDGQRGWSADALASLITEILKRHKMRNVRVVARK